MFKEQYKIYTYMLILIISILAILLRNPIILILISTSLLIIIIRLAKWSFFTELSFLLWYAYFEGFIQKTVGISNSTLAWAGVHMPYYFNELSLASITFLVIEIGFFLFTNIISNEKKIYETNLRIPFGITLLLAMTSSILMILVFPSLPTFTSNLLTRRTQGLSNLYGLVLLALVLDGLTVDQSFNHKILYLFYMFDIFWSFGHAERVEVIGFVSYLILKSINYYKINSDTKTFKRIKHFFYLFILLIIFIAMYIGLYRINNSQVTMSEFISNFLTQGTVGDVTYIFNCATDLWKNNNLTHGITYFDYLLRLIPGMHSNYSSEIMLRNLYPETMGGQLFYAEPMMNFGMIGTIIMNFVFFVVMGFILHKDNRYMCYFYIPIVIEVFRTAYYGRASWLLACLVEIPIIYCLIYILKKLFYSNKAYK